MRTLKRTPLANVHEALGARMVEFAGFMMPVSYGSIIAEHRAVREKAGLFDVSHMGEFVVSGPGVKDFINQVITNDCSKLGPGSLQYTVMCRSNGTVVDDLLVYMVAEDRALLVVNAANIEKDFAHISTFDKRGVELENASDDCALLAVQGPASRDILRACQSFSAARDSLDNAAYYSGFSLEVDSSEVLVSRTGYTGELGFEVFVPPRLAGPLWGEVVRAGSGYGLVPVGLAARDTLRFEASYCLYGHEINDETTPLEAGLGWVVKLKKSDFCGIESLRAEHKNGSRRKLIGLELEGRNIARQGFAVLKNGEKTGEVTSGAFSPTLQRSLCMALVERGTADEKDKYEVLVRDKVVPASVTRLPFYPSRAK